MEAITSSCVLADLPLRPGIVEDLLQYTRRKQFISLIEDSLPRLIGTGFPHVGKGEKFRWAAFGWLVDVVLDVPFLVKQHTVFQPIFLNQFLCLNADFSTYNKFK